MNTFTINKIQLANRQERMRLKRTEQKVADIIAFPIAVILIITFYILKLISKILFKFKKWLWRISLFSLIFLFVGSNLTISVSSPKSQAALNAPFVTPTPKPIVTKEDIIYSQKHGDIIYRIWNNETSKGVATDPTGINVKCAKQGLSNELGFDPQDNYCFPSFTVSVQRVNSWFDACLSKNTLSQCLEIYSGNSKQYINSFLNQ